MSRLEKGGYPCGGHIRAAPKVAIVPPRPCGAVTIHVDRLVDRRGLVIKLVMEEPPRRIPAHSKLVANKGPRSIA